MAKRIEGVSDEVLRRISMLHSFHTPISIFIRTTHCRHRGQSTFPTNNFISNIFLIICHLVLSESRSAMGIRSFRDHIGKRAHAVGRLPGCVDTKKSRSGQAKPCRSCPDCINKYSFTKAPVSVRNFKGSPEFPIICLESVHW